MNALSHIRQTVHAGLACVLATVACFASTPAHAGAKVLQFISGAANAPVNNAKITLDDARLNGKSSLRLIITQLLDTSTGVYNDHPVGVQYDATAKKWQIVNEDGAAMPVGAYFNVLAPAVTAPATVTRVYSGPANSYYDRTFFPLAKKNPNARLLETHVFNPFPKISGDLLFNGVNLTKNVGLYYIPAGTGKPVPSASASWSIYNEDQSPPLAVAYNVADVTKSKVNGTSISFIFSTTAGNVIGTVAKISPNPLTDNKPDAILFVNHVFTDTNDTLFDHRVAVDYISGQWRIFTEDSTAMPAGVDFVVAVFPAITP